MLSIDPRAKGYIEYRYLIIKIVGEIPDCNLPAWSYYPAPAPKGWGSVPQYFPPGTKVEYSLGGAGAPGLLAVKLSRALGSGLRKQLYRASRQTRAPRHSRAARHRRVVTSRHQDTPRRPRIPRRPRVFLRHPPATPQAILGSS